MSRLPPPVTPALETSSYSKCKRLVEEIIENVARRIEALSPNDRAALTAAKQANTLPPTHTLEHVTSHENASCVAVASDGLVVMVGTRLGELHGILLPKETRVVVRLPAAPAKAPAPADKNAAVKPAVPPPPTTTTTTPSSSDVVITQVAISPRYSPPFDMLPPPPATSYAIAALTESSLITAMLEIPPDNAPPLLLLYGTAPLPDLAPPGSLQLSLSDDGSMACLVGRGGECTFYAIPDQLAPGKTGGLAPAELKPLLVVKAEQLKSLLLLDTLKTKDRMGVARGRFLHDATPPSKTAVTTSRRPRFHLGSLLPPTKFVLHIAQLNALTLIDLQQPQALPMPWMLPHVVTDFAISADAKHLAAGTSDGSVYTYPLPHGPMRLVMHLDQAPIQRVCFVRSTQPMLLLAIDGAGSVIVRDSGHKSELILDAIDTESRRNHPVTNVVANRDALFAVLEAGSVVLYDVRQRMATGRLALPPGYEAYASIPLSKQHHGFGTVALLATNTVQVEEAIVPDPPLPPPKKGEQPPPVEYRSVERQVTSVLVFDLRPQMQREPNAGRRSSAVRGDEATMTMQPSLKMQPPYALGAREQRAWTKALETAAAMDNFPAQWASKLPEIAARYLKTDPLPPVLSIHKV